VAAVAAAAVVAPLQGQATRADSAARRAPSDSTVRGPAADTTPRAAAAAPDSAAWTGSAVAARGQALLYDGRFEEAGAYFSTLARRYPADPTGPALAASALIWWGEARQDDRFAKDSINALLSEAARRADRAAATAATDSARVVGLFWAGTALGYRARQADLHGSYFAAVHDAKGMRAALDSALALDSGCVDCRLGLAVYDYALARAGLLVRLVAGILGLGGGNADSAVATMRLVSERGAVARVEARWVYANALLREGRKKGDPRRAEGHRLIAALAAEFPGNPVFRRFAISSSP
jgi:hypothetical protein